MWVDKVKCKHAEIPEPFKPNWLRKVAFTDKFSAVVHEPGILN